MINMPDTPACAPKAAACAAARKRQSELGQFMTSHSVARFMAALFPPSTLHTCRLLDAGAGVGALTGAFLRRWHAGEGFVFAAAHATAYEIDASLRQRLTRCLAEYRKTTARIIIGDYIKLVTAEDLPEPGYTHIILNPPYKKINSHSVHRQALRSVGVETVNLYSAFVALALRMAAPGGQLVAIIPRSFCNGPYYRPFRKFLLEHAALRHMHLFASRTEAFKADRVLQENIIIRLERGGRQGPVTVSTSTDDTFVDLVRHAHPFARIVLPDDPEQFIHVPTSPQKSALEGSISLRGTLTDLGIKVSTGPVVDFRLKAHLRALPECGTVPLLYPGHFSRHGVTWPMASAKKPNAIVRDAESERWLYPNAYYCVVRRFSSKEEKRRIVASVVEPNTFGDAPRLGFENHLNVFHDNKRGLPKALAHGLALFLNTTAVDEHFRRFSGHTQVNATDLKLLHYPCRASLIEMGQWFMQQGALTQEQIDAKLKAMVA